MRRIALSFVLLFFAALVNVGNSRAIIARGDIDAAVGRNLTDSTVYEASDAPTTLCSRGTGNQGCFYFMWPGNQIRFLFLSAEDKEKIWTEAGDRGKRLKQDMDYYVSRDLSRLDDERSDQDDRFRDNYKINFQLTMRNVPVARIGWGINKQFRQAGISSVDGDSAFDQTSMQSKNTPDGAGIIPLPVISLGTSPLQNTIISISSYATNDNNPPAQKAYSSTITWNVWKNAAGASASQLKYQMRHRISNVVSNNIMSLAHEKYRSNVDAIPLRFDTPIPEQDGPRTGYGRWTPSDEAYPYLLSMPNLETCVQMVIDYNTQMDNKYIAVIYTFPEVNRIEFPKAYEEDLREGYIIVEYGAYPAQPGDGQALPVPMDVGGNPTSVGESAVQKS